MSVGRGAVMVGREMRIAMQSGRETSAGGFDRELIAQWSERLCSLGERWILPGDGAGVGEAELAGFADEMGNRRPVDRPLVARVWGVSAGAMPADARDDERLWWALHDATLGVDEVYAEAFLKRTLKARNSAGREEAWLLDCPVLARRAGTIEVFTQSQLSALHAAWDLSVARGRGDLRVACLHACEWFIENLQPDNATNHPWAAQVFVMKAATCTGAEQQELRGSALMYAQTLLHNCRVHLGRPDRFSAAVLVDAGRALLAELR